MDNAPFDDIIDAALAVEEEYAQGLPADVEQSMLQTLEDRSEPKLLRAVHSLLLTRFGSTAAFRKFHEHLRDGSDDIALATAVCLLIDQWPDASKLDDRRMFWRGFFSTDRMKEVVGRSWLQEAALKGEVMIAGSRMVAACTSSSRFMRPAQEMDADIRLSLCEYVKRGLDFPSRDIILSWLGTGLDVVEAGIAAYDDPRADAQFRGRVISWTSCTKHPLTFSLVRRALLQDPDWGVVAGAASCLSRCVPDAASKAEVSELLARALGRPEVEIEGKRYVATSLGYYDDAGAFSALTGYLQSARSPEEIGVALHGIESFTWLCSTMPERAGVLAQYVGADDTTTGVAAASALWRLLEMAKRKGVAIPIVGERSSQLALQIQRLRSRMASDSSPSEMLRNLERMLGE